ncbi:MAG: single-stranded DNA-binding protein [Paludibacteraceae bacterium]|nr:single-stranded DNA-binding protein [Paludibacteraceae bacterium]MBO7259192.1 single-stranded DNA-binding protein [Paludibacteraceae bacterium]
MAVNKVILLGNVGRDPEVRYVDKNVAVVSFSLATTERGFTTANGTVVPERTEWHNIVAWRSLAQFVENYVKRGAMLYIEGKLQTRSWEKEGQTHYRTEILADTIQLLDKRDKTNESGPVPTSPSVVAESSGDEDLPF